MPKKNSSDSISLIARDNNKIHTFPKGISLQVNVITWLDFEPVKYNVISSMLATTSQRILLVLF